MINLFVGALNGAVAVTCFNRGVENWAWVNLILSAMNIALFLSNIL